MINTFYYVDLKLEDFCQFQCAYFLASQSVVQYNGFNASLDRVAIKALMI